jgi:bis(5'-nucleosidyl)-tetraphosphatase
MQSTKSCGIIVYRQLGDSRKYLVIHDSRNSKWGFPKGHQIDNETDLQTAKREVYEEVGLRPLIVSDHTITITFVNRKNIHRTVVYFIGEAGDEPVALQADEISEYQWLRYNEALEKINFKEFKDALVSAEEYLNNFKKK